MMMVIVDASREPDRQGTADWKQYLQEEVVKIRPKKMLGLGFS